MINSQKVTLEAASGDSYNYEFENEKMCVCGARINLSALGLQLKVVLAATSITQPNFPTVGYCHDTFTTKKINGIKKIIFLDLTDQFLTFCSNPVML